MTCQSLISDLSGVESACPARNKCTSPGRVHLLCGAVQSAGSQLPLEGTERYIFRAMVKIKVL